MWPIGTGASSGEPGGDRCLSAGVRASAAVTAVTGALRASRSADAVTPPPGAAVERVRAALNRADPTAAVIVDFDETLWLRNSTETFLDAARPRWLVLALLLLVDALRPWVWRRRPCGYDIERDWWRVRLVARLLPWTLPRWRRLAPTLAVRHANVPLLDLLGRLAPRPVGVATLGFAEVVGPLLAELDPRLELWAAADLGRSGWRIRAIGKLAPLRDRLGSALAAAVVVTDSERDRDLERGVGEVVVVPWPNARFRPAQRGFYLPLRYTEQGKRAGERYVRREIFQVDIALAVVITATAAGAPLAAAIAAVFLTLSFWCVYELGYRENDALGRRLEAKPVLNRRSMVLAATVRPALAWASAAVLGVVGLAAAAHAGAAGRLPPAAIAAAGVGWALYLVATRLTYGIFNRSDERSRAFLYLALQSLRCYAPLVLLPATAPGIAALTALVISRWVPYLCYRWAGKWLGLPETFLLFAVYLVLVTPHLLEGAARGDLVLAGLLAVVFGFRARHNWRQLRRAFRWLPRRPVGHTGRRPKMTG
jgi:hypothetical protein